MMKVSNIYFMKRSVRSTWISLRLIETNHKSNLYIGLIRFLSVSKEKSPKSQVIIILEKIIPFFVEVNSRIDLTVLQDSFLAMGNRFILTVVQSVLFNYENLEIQIQRIRFDRGPPGFLVIMKSLLGH